MREPVFLLLLLAAATTTTASPDKGAAAAAAPLAAPVPVAPSYGAPAAPQPKIKYGGPIVYSGEKPPIIHFPPPPSNVRSICNELTSFPSWEPSIYIYIFFVNLLPDPVFWLRRRQGRPAARGEVRTAAAPRPTRAHLPVHRQAAHPRGPHAAARQGAALLPAAEADISGGK